MKKLVGDFNRAGVAAQKRTRAARLTARARRLLVPVALVALATGVGSGAASNTTATVRSVTTTALKAKILVDSAGFTLYHLTSEKKRTVSCTAQCRKKWPPLLVAKGKKPNAGAGVSASKLGTLKRPDGGIQVTYNGHALYTY
ncbi:MAG: COG4315 family predicted lipoprotein, partial [Solirubrobacteraceae bacterium]